MIPRRCNQIGMASGKNKTTTKKKTYWSELLHPWWSMPGWPESPQHTAATTLHHSPEACMLNPTSPGHWEMLTFPKREGHAGVTSQTRCDPGVQGRVNPSSLGFRAKRATGSNSSLWGGEKQSQVSCSQSLSSSWSWPYASLTLKILPSNPTQEDPVSSMFRNHP